MKKDNLLLEAYDMSFIKDKKNIRKMYNICIKYKDNDALLLEEVMKKQTDQIIEILNESDDSYRKIQDQDFLIENSYLFRQQVMDSINNPDSKNPGINVDEKVRNIWSSGDSFRGVQTHVVSGIMGKGAEVGGKGMKWAIINGAKFIFKMVHELSKSLFGDKLGGAVGYIGGYFVVAAVSLGLMRFIITKFKNWILYPLISAFKEFGNIANFVKSKVKGKRSSKDEDRFDDQYEFEKYNNSMRGIISKVESGDLKALASMPVQMKDVNRAISQVIKDPRGNHILVNNLKKIRSDKDRMYKGMVTKLKNQGNNDLASKLDEERLEAIRKIDEAINDILGSVSKGER